MMVAAVEAGALSEALALQHLPGLQNKVLVSNTSIRFFNYGLDGITESPISITGVPRRAGISGRLICLAAADENSAVW